MEIFQALEFAKPIGRATLATIKINGRPQLSNILFTISKDVLQVSVLKTRAKTINMLRDPRVSVHVTSGDFRSFVVIDGLASCSPVVADPHDQTADEMIIFYQQIDLLPENVEQFRHKLVADERLLVSITATHAYGLLPSAK